MVGRVGRRRRNPGPNPAPDHRRAVRVQNQDEARSASGVRHKVSTSVRPSSEGTFEAAQLSAIMIVMNMYDFAGEGEREGGRARCDER